MTLYEQQVQPADAVAEDEIMQQFALAINRYGRAFGKDMLREALQELLDLIDAD